MLCLKKYPQSLRGGGSASSSSNNSQEIPKSIQIEAQLHSNLLNGFLVSLNKRLEQIDRIKEIMSTEEGKNVLYRNIVWLQDLEQIFCYFQFQIELLKKHKQIIERTFQYFLELSSSIIQWDRLITLKILKICNTFVRLLFIYYTHSNERSNKQQIDKWMQLSNNINYYIELDGEAQLFYNGLVYELNLIKACIEYIPTQEEAQQKNDTILGILKEIFNSAVNLKPSPDLLSSIQKGALFLYQQFQKKKSMEQFQNCLFLEQLKWNIIISIKAGMNFNQIEDRISENFKIIIKNGSDWAIQYSWIKMASELMSCKPLITKIKFLTLQTGSNQQMTWEQAQSDNLINVVNKDFEIAEIIVKQSSSEMGIKLQSILRQYQKLQNFFMNGNDVIPQFIGYYSLDAGKDTLNLDNQSNQEYFKIILELRQIPFEKVVFNINEFLKKFQTFLTSYYQIDSKGMNFNDLQYHLILSQEQCQYLLNDVIKFQISLDFINNIIKTITSLLIKSNEIKNHQETIYLNCFQAFLFNYSKIQSKKLFDKKRNIFEMLMNWLNQKKLVQEQQNSYQKQFGKKMPEHNIDSSKIQEKSFQYQLNYIVNSIQFCQQWNQQIQLLTSLLTAEQVLINQKIMITKQSSEVEMKSQIDTLIQEFSQSQNDNFEYYHSIYSILLLQYDQFSDLKILIYDKFSLDEFENINKKQKIELQIDNKFDFNEYFLYQINQHKQFNQLLETENQVLLNQIKEYQKSKLNINFNYICSFLNYSLLSINSTLNFNFDFIKKMEMLIEWSNKKDAKSSFNFKSNQNKLLSIMDSFKTGKEKIDLLTNNEYVEKVKELEVQVQAMQQELLIINNSDAKTQLGNELNKFNEFLVLARTRQKNQLDSTIQTLKKCTLDFIDKVVNFFENLERSWKQELITEMSESIDERKPNQQKLQESITDFKNQVMYIQQSIDFSDIEILQNLVDLLKFTEQGEVIHIQCEEQIIKLQQRFQQLIQNIKSLQYESFCLKFAEQVYSINQNQNDLDRFLKDEMNFIFSPIQNQLQANIRQCKQSITSSILDFVKGNSWRVKEGFIFQCIQLESFLQDQSKQAIQKILILVAAKETDLKILVTLKNKQIVQQMYSGFSKNWPDVQGQIQQDLNNQITRLEQLQFNIQNAETDRQREQLLKEHKQLEEQVEQQIMNVNQIGDALGITINFLRDIKQDLNKIQQKLDQMLNKIDELVQDIKQLIGKTPKQLLEIRMQSILQQKNINDFNNVYVNLRTKELKENFKDEDDETTIFNDVFQNKGEIDEFLQQSKDSLLIHGPAGSGKSVAAKKIEEYIWLQYQQLNLDEWSKELEQVPVVPIFIQLASLKDPYLKAVDETLSSSNYNFDRRQIQAFQALVEEGKVAVVFILDSFDELSNNQINLIQSNKLKNWKHQLQNLSELTTGQQKINNLNYPKIITTTRSEVFELNSTNYRQWFSSDVILDFSKYKELRILSFDEKQKKNYLKQFSYIQIKKTLLDYFEKFSLIKKKGKNLLNEVSLIWNNIQQKLERFHLHQLQNLQYLSDKEINFITQILKSEYKLQSKQDQVAILERSLRQIQTPLFYENNIIDFNLEQLLKTPFMMKIVLDVLPLMNSEKQKIQENYFISNYIFQMNEKYVKKKENKMIIQFLERISHEQYKQDQKNQLNDDQPILEQADVFEQYMEYERGSRQQTCDINKQSERGVQQNPEYYQAFTNLNEQRQNQYKPQNQFPVNSYSQEPVAQRVSQQYQPYQQQMRYDDLSFPKNTVENSRQSAQFTTGVDQQQKYISSTSPYFQQKKVQTIQMNQAFQRTPEYYQEQSSFNEPIVQITPPYQKQVRFNDQSFAKSTIESSQQRVYSQSNYAVRPNSDYVVQVQNHRSNDRRERSVNFRLQQELKLKQNLTFKVAENLKQSGKSIWQKVQNITQLDYDQFGDDKQIILKSYKSFKLTQYDFYEQFLQNYIQDQMQKLSINQQQKFNNNFIYQVDYYVRMLASYLMEQQLTSIDTQKTSNMQNLFTESIIRTNIKDTRYTDLLYDNSDEIYLVKKCLPLKQTGSVLSFEHKSIQEFTYAKLIIENLFQIRMLFNKLNEINIDILDEQGKKLKKKNFVLDCMSLLFNSKKQSPDLNLAENYFFQSFSGKYPNNNCYDYFDLIQQLIINIESSPLNQFIMSNQFYMGVIRFLVEYISNNQQLKSILHFLILISKLQKSFVNISSNSFQLLAYMQEQFNDKDFTQIQIKDVKLLGIKCICCDFTGSIFENVTLMGTNLNYCKIAKVEWKNIISQDLPTLSFKIGPIRKASFSPDGNFIAGLGQNKKLFVYLIPTSEIIKQVDLQNDVLDFCWSNTKSMLVYFISEQKMNIINFLDDYQQTKTIQIQLKVGDIVKLIKFSNQDNYLSIACQKGKVIIYKNVNQQFTQFREIIGKGRITAFDFSPEEDNLLVCDQSSIFLFKILDDQSKNIKNLPQNQQVNSIVFSPDGQLFAYSTNNEAIIIYNLIKQKEQAKLIGHQKAVRCLCFSIEGNILISGGDDKCVRIWDYMKGQQVGENSYGHHDVINSVEFSKPDGKIILSAGKDGLIKQWYHTDNYRVSEYLPGHDGAILFMAISQDQQRIITKSKNKQIIQWNFKTGSIVNEKIYLQSCQECSISKLCSACSLSPIIIIEDDQFIVTGGFGHSIVTYDSFTGKSIHPSIQYLKPKGEVAYFSYAQSNHLVCSSTLNGEIKIWDCLNGKQFGNKINLNLQVLTVFFGLEFNLIALDKLGKYININISPANKNAQSFQFQLNDEGLDMKQINLQIGNEICDQQNELNQQNTQQNGNSRITCYALKSDNSFLAIANKDSKVYIFDTKDLQKIHSQHNYQGTITSMNFDKTGLSLILSFEDYSIKIWDILNNEHGSKNYCHQDQINFVCLSQENKFIASSSFDKSIKIWRIKDKDDNNFISKYIDEIKKRISQQRDNSDNSQVDFKIIFEMTNKCEQFLGRFRNYRELEDLNYRQQQLINQIEEKYHHLSELRRINMSTTLRAQQNLEFEIKKQMQMIEELLRENQEIKLKKNQLAILLFQTGVDFSKEIQTISEDNLKKYQNIVDNNKPIVELNNQIEKQDSQLHVNQQSQIIFTEILCISKNPQNSKFIGTAFEQSSIKNKTNHDLFKLWQQTQEKEKEVND